MGAKPTVVQLILNAPAFARSIMLAASASAHKTLLSLTKSDVGLSNVDNTADAAKPVSAAQQTAIDAKIGGSVGATDNRLVRSDGTGTRTVQATGITVDDSDNVSGIGTLTIADNRLIRMGTSGNTQIDVQGSQYFAVRTSGSFERFGWFQNRFCLSQGTWLAAGPNNIGSEDVTLSRNTAGVWQMGTSTTANASGSLLLANLTASGLIGLGTYTVATLPSASANPRRIAAVTDSSVTANGSAVAGGGSSSVMVFSNGSTWDVVVA